MEIKGLNYSYTGESLLFKDFEFSTTAPLVILKGPSGCGKTTLLKIFFGISNGSMSFEKLDVSTNSYMILQDDALCPWLTGVQNITKFIPCKLNDYEHSFLYQHIKSFVYKKACYMSFGQRRLIELLRALLYKPHLLLWDEPLNYLDALSRDIVVEELKRFINDGNRQVVLSDHYNQKFDAIPHEVFLFPDKKPIMKLYREK